MSSSEAEGVSLRRNLLANFISQAYVGLAGLVVLPLYLRHLGAEAYGLVGFFSVLQSWLQVLDFGLSSTLVREVARFRAGGSSAGELRAVLRFIDLFFFGAGALVAVAIWGAGSWIARTWLVPRAMPLEEVAVCVSWMGVAVALRWISGLKKGVLVGFERQVWLAVFNTAIATLRFPGALVLIAFVTSSPKAFFLYQAVVAALELAFLLVFSGTLLPAGDRSSGRTFEQVKPALKFSLSLAFVSSVWLLTTQFDKLLLSRLLPLAEYGYFTVGTTLAGAITLLMAPVSQAILPRMTVLLTQGDREGVKSLYRTATQAMTVFVAPAAAVLVAYSSDLIGVWTGDPKAAVAAGPVLVWYVLGNGLLAIAAFPYYLQYASGNLRLHVLGNIFFVVILIPALIVATLRWGALGAGRAWFAINLIYFLAWTPLVHARFFPGLHTDWTLRDILPPALAGAVPVMITALALPTPSGKLASFAFWGALGAAGLLAGGSASSAIRKAVAAHFGKVPARG